MTLGTILVVAVFAVVIGMFVIIALRAWWRYRGVRVITCPETRRPAAVEVDSGYAALSAAWETLDLRLQSCSRWPERADCDQDCLTEIRTSPHETKLEAILDDLFAGRPCVLCGKPIPHVSPVAHRPALRAPDGTTIGVDAIAPEHIFDLARTHGQVCWNCHVAETFRREHPELVIDR